MNARECIHTKKTLKIIRSLIFFPQVQYSEISRKLEENSQDYVFTELLYA